MSPSLRRPLLLIFTVGLAPQFFLRPLWSSVFVIVLLGYRWWLEWGQKNLPPKFVQWLTQALVGGVVFVHYGSILGPESAGTLLTLLSCLKTYELRSKRDAFALVLMGLLTLMTFLLLEQGLTLTGFLFVVVFLYLVFLRALSFGRWSDDWWERFVRPSTGLLFKAVPILIVSFILFPRFSTGFGGVGRTQGKMGVSDRLNPGSVAGLVESDELVFRARFLKGEMPPKSNLYWRSVVLDVSDGLSWTRSEQMQVRPANPVWDNPEVEVFLETGSDRFLFALGSHDLLSFPNDMVAAPQSRGQLQRVLQMEGGVFSLREALQTRERYVLGAGQGEREPSLLGDPTRYLQAPKVSSKDAAMIGFLKQFRGLSENEIIRKLMNHWRNGGYGYSLQPPTVNSLGEFLFATKVGFCEHYSAATATILRWLNVPARVVIGFQGGSSSVLDNFVTVRGHDAHSWVEYYDSQAKRWRRLDPTGEVAPIRLQLGGNYLSPSDDFLSRYLSKDWRVAYSRVQASIDEVEAAWIGFLLRFDLSKQQELLEKLGMESALFRALPVFLVLAIVLILALLYFFEALGRETLSAEEKVYRQFIQRLKRLKLTKLPSQGWLDWQAALMESNPAAAREVEGIVQQFMTLRYADQPLSQDQLRALRQQIKRLASRPRSG